MEKMNIKTVETMTNSMKDSLKFLDSRLGFIKEDSIYKDHKEVSELLEKVNTYIQSSESTIYFEQWYTNAEIFDELLKNLKFKSEEAEKEFHKSNLSDNAPLAETKALLENLSERIDAAQEQSK